MAYVNIFVVEKGQKYRARVDSNAGLEELKSLFIQKLGKSGEYEMVALTHFGLVENSEWKLIEKSKDDLIDTFELYNEPS